MKFKVVSNAWWLPWAKAAVVWRWVWFRAELHKDRTAFRHELEHCYQMHRMGRLRFYAKYLWLLARHGYKAHPYEVEAQQAAVKRLTLQEINWQKAKKIVLN